jgi:2-octaprenyl-6-methoxyphenol hydroxylase
MNTSEPLDVIIVGAGMAGMTLALALEAGGLKVALVEKQPFEAQLDIGYDGRASAIAYACFRQWKALGVGDALEPLACRMDEIFVTDGRLPGAATGRPLPAMSRWATCWKTAISARPCTRRSRRAISA